MCTVSWQVEGEAFRLYFNRDERKARKKADPPRVFDGEGLRFLCPIDTERGGTWIAANSAGCVVCLLNDYKVPFDVDLKYESRGGLVKSLAGCQTAKEVAQHLSLESKNAYPPYTLLFWDGEVMRSWGWDGSTLSFGEEVNPPFSSSSWDSERVETFRKELYQRRVVDDGWSGRSYHHRVEVNDSESSVCMMREETQTVSITEVKVMRDAVVMRYFPRDEDGAFLSKTEMRIERDA